MNFREGRQCREANSLFSARLKFGYYKKKKNIHFNRSSAYEEKEEKKELSQVYIVYA